MQKKLYHILYYVCNKKKCFLHNINVELVVIFYDFHLNNSTPPIISAIPMYLFQVNATFSLPIRPNASINAATKSCEMKMENEIVAPKAGTIGQVFATLNQNVNSGDNLISII